jgi:nucleoside-triphosphatase THEP1
MIYILTGPIRSYKTTTLLHWTQLRRDCGGVLSPDVDGLRCLYNVRERKYLPWQKEKKEKESDVEIGKFVFNRDSFDAAQHWLDEHLVDPNLRYVLLDEVGPLELNGKGWDGWLHRALMHPGETSLILVVRENILDEVISHYALTDYTVVGKDYFEIL